MNDTFRIKTNKIDIDDLSHYLNKYLTTTRFYLDPKKSKEENIDLIIALVKTGPLYIDKFLTDTIKQIKRTELRKGLIRYFISVAFGVDLSCVNKMRRFVQDILDGCVLIHCPSSSIVLTHDGRIIIPENQYSFTAHDSFLVGHKVQDLAARLHPAQRAALGDQRFAIDYQTYCVFSSNGDEIIPCSTNPVSVGTGFPKFVKLWLNDIGYMIYPLTPYYKHYIKTCLESFKESYGFSEWIIKVAGEDLYHLTLSDCYLFDECKVGPREIDLVSSKDYELYTDCSLTRPSIYDSPDRERMMSSATDEEINDLLRRTAVEVEKLIGRNHIIQLTQLDEVFTEVSED